MLSTLFWQFLTVNERDEVGGNTANVKKSQVLINLYLLCLLIVDSFSNV